MRHANADVNPASSDFILTPILSSKSFKAWPKHDEGGTVRYASHVKAFTDHYRSDAHFAAYSHPDVPRRLSRDAVGKLDGGVHMRLVVFDVDGAGHAAGDEWWEQERPKIFDLLEEHRDGMVYRTRGGYRIVYLLSRPVYLRDVSDADSWTDLYVSWCRYLARRFAIVADHACKDWQRLYRLPHATRDEGGEPEDREIIGEPANIGTWSCPLAAEDMTIELPASSKKVMRETTAPRNATHYTGRGRLVDAFDRNGWLGNEIERGKYSARCPWESTHSKGETFDTSTVLFEADPARGDLGWFKCSHAHCTDRGIDDVIKLFTDDEMGNVKLLKDSPRGSGSDTATIPVGFPLVQIGAVPDLGPTRWLVDSLWSDQACGFVGGKPKGGKSWLSLYLGLCVASGKPAFGRFAVARGRVVVFNAEDKPGRTKERVRMMCRWMDIDINAIDFHLIDVHGLRLDRDEDICKLRAMVAAHRPTLLILDPLRRLFHGDEDKASDMDPMLETLRLIQREFQCSVMVVHHVKKIDGDADGQSLRGSSVFHAWLDSALYVTAKGKQWNDPRVVHVEHRDADNVDPFGFQLNKAPMVEGEALWLEMVDTKGNKPDDADVDENKVISVLQGAVAPMAMSAIATAANKRNGWGTETIKALVTKGTVDAIPAGRWVHYQLASRTH